MIKRKFQHTFTLLNVDRVNPNSRWNYLNVISPYNRIYYIDEGEGELSGAVPYGHYTDELFGNQHTDRV